MPAPRILFLGLNYRPEEIGIAVYSQELCAGLAARGFAVEAIVAKPYYPDWRIFDGYRGLKTDRAREDGVDVTRVPLYVPAEPTGVRRILHHLSFALSGGPRTVLRALVKRPDMVVTVAPSLIAAPWAWVAARLVGATCWLHVQDFEVGAAFSTGLMRPTGLGARAALWFERTVMRRFDVVSTISFEMVRRLLAMGIDRADTYELRNWADTSRIFPLKRESHFRRRWSIETPHVALYSGNIANKQGIEIIVEAAKRLRHRGDLTFVICGEGPNRARLERAAAGLDNIQFHDLQPVEQLNELMALASVHLLPQLAGAADLLLPSKLTNMLASGRPVVATAAPDTGLAREIEDCGLIVPPGDADHFAEAIGTLLDDGPLRDRLGAGGRRRATGHWDREAILSALVQRVRLGLGGRGRAPVASPE